MKFLKCVKVALIISGVTFTIASLPAARLGNENVDIQLNSSQVFSGQMRDISGAYLSIAGLISLSLGIAGFSLAAWRQTGSSLQQTKRAIAELEALLQKREHQLQAAQLAPTRMQQTGLTAFLEDDLAPAPPAPAMKQLPVSQTVPISNAANHIAARPRVKVHQRATVAPAAVRPPAQRQRRLSPSQASQLQAVQAQLNQQRQQVQRAAVVQRAQASRNTGFTVINPYQVQPNRQRSLQANSRMA